MIINKHRDALSELKRIKSRRAKIPKTYTQIQYERAEAKQNKIKNHNERQLQLMKEKNK